MKMSEIPEIYHGWDTKSILVYMGSRALRMAVGIGGWARGIGWHVYERETGEREMFSKPLSEMEKPEGSAHEDLQIWTAIAREAGVPEEDIQFVLDLADEQAAWVSSIDPDSLSLEEAKYIETHELRDRIRPGVKIMDASKPLMAKVWEEFTARKRKGKRDLQKAEKIVLDACGGGDMGAFKKLVAKLAKAGAAGRDLDMLQMYVHECQQANIDPDAIEDLGPYQDVSDIEDVALETLRALYDQI